ncbi:MAG TPA: CdaR family protein [Candidatus Limnocylindrales bacterium]
MNRLFRFIVHNWPLKLAAIALATLLYAGLIVSANAQSVGVGIPINARNPPPNTITIGSLGEVTEIRYFVGDPTNVPITSANFTATVDLSGVQPGPEAQSVRVHVDSADPRIQIISATPAFVSVRLEKVVPRTVPVVVVPGTVPEGLTVRPPKASLTEATILGAQSDVARVSAVRATVTIDTSAIDIDRDFPLTPVDELGEPVRGVEVDPPTVHVTMAVFKDRRTATVPIVPTIVGTVAPGFEIESVTTSVPVVAIEGDPENLANVPNARTLPVSVDGQSADVEQAVAFDLPSGVSAVSPATVRVHVALRAISQSRSFAVGIVLDRTRADRAYALSIPQALLTLGGAPADLDALNGAALAVTADVGELDVGSHTVDLKFAPRAGLTVVAISPATVTVVVSLPTGGSASPGASSASASAAP